MVLEGHNVIIYGQAGVGKTRVINVLYKTIKQKKQNINITASVGIATLPFNGHATTLHTWCGLSAHDGRFVVCWSLTSLCHSNGHIETHDGRFQTKDLIEQIQTDDSFTEVKKGSFRVMFYVLMRYRWYHESCFK